MTSPGTLNGFNAVAPSLNSFRYVFKGFAESDQKNQSSLRRGKQRHKVGEDGSHALEKNWRLVIGQSPVVFLIWTLKTLLEVLPQIF